MVTLPRDMSQPLGNSEFSHGMGMFPHPDTDFQKGRLPFPEEEPINDQFKKLVAARRSDPTVGDETERDLMFAKGNPDRFGGQPALVRTTAQLPPKTFPTPDVKTRVDRED